MRKVYTANYYRTPAKCTGLGPVKQITWESWIQQEIPSICLAICSVSIPRTSLTVVIKLDSYKYLEGTGNIYKYVISIFITTTDRFV